MSVQSAKDFLQRMETDKALRDQLGSAADQETRWKIIHQAGGDFTQEEFEQAVAELTAAASQELTSEELQEIAGGRGWCACEGPQYNYLKL